MSTTGRPTKLTAEVLKKAEAYLEKLPRDEIVHSVEGLAVYLGVARSTVYKWTTDESENAERFSDIVEGVLSRQATTLINKGLKGTFQPTITKVMLTKHGLREGHEHTGANGEPLLSDEQKEKGKSVVKRFLGTGEAA